MEQQNFLEFLRKTFKYIIMVAGTIFFIVHFIPGSWFIKTWSYVATIGLAFVPDLLRLMGMKISRRLEIWYYVFIFFAMILGIDLDLYRWEFFPYDKVVHMASGFFVAFVAREIVEQASGKPDMLWFKALFSISFVAFTACLWECFEFMMDRAFGQHMQELITTGVADTMWDMISALAGGVLGTTIAFPTKVTK